MSQIAPLLNTLKRELRAQGVNYSELASRLGLSESSIKRVFAESRISLDRLEQISQVLGLEISDLVQKMNEQRQRLQMLSEEQEREVVDDQKLLLMSICALNQWSFQEICATYTLTEHEVVQLFARLDRLKIIELLPANRYKVVVDNEFRWIPGGPIQRFFRETVQPGFMQSSFARPGEKLLFHNGMLSRGSNATIMKKMERLIAEFNELHDEDAALPLAERFGTSLLVAMRPWEFGFFRDLRRTEEKVF